MAEGKNKIIIYRDWLSTFEALSNEEAGQLIKHLFRYVNDQDPEPPSRLIGLVFENLKQTLKRDLKTYEHICQRNRNNGAKGGRPPKTQEKSNNPNNPMGFLVTQRNPKKPDNDNDNDINNGNSKLFPSNTIDSLVKKDSSDKINPNKNLKENLLKRETEFIARVREFDQYPSTMLDAFLNYWTEKNKSGTKMRYELERTFEVSRRLSTWASREKTTPTFKSKYEPVIEIPYPSKSRLKNQEP